MHKIFNSSSLKKMLNLLTSEYARKLYDHFTSSITNVWFGNSIYTSFKIKNIVDLKINKVTYHIAETKEDYDMTQN